MNPSMNFGLNSVKIQEQTILMIQMYLLSVQIEWMTLIKILMATVQAEEEKL